MSRSGDLVVKSERIKAFILSAPMVRLPFASPVFTLKFATFNAFPFTTSNVMWTPQNPLFDYTLKRLESRPEPLWSSFVCKKNAAAKIVVKVKLQRRVRAAYWLSLAKCGYGKDGKVMKGGKENEGINNNGIKKDLFGTAQFLIEDVCLKANHEELQKQMDSAIQAIIHRQKLQNTKFNGRNGRNSYPMKRQSRPYRSVRSDS